MSKDKKKKTMIKGGRAGENTRLKDKKKFKNARKNAKPFKFEL